MLNEFFFNLTHNLFKPLLLFFYAGFLISVLRVRFEFPKPIYQGLTIYLLLAIGWHGGEELAGLQAGALGQALGLMAIGFCTNTAIGLLAYWILRSATQLRQVDAATVAGYYGSDSAGTFVTALGVLTAAQVAFAPYMPVMLAVMEIPGCLVALYLVSRLRAGGMDANGNMPHERGYIGKIRTGRLTAPIVAAQRQLVSVGASGDDVHYSRDTQAAGKSNRFDGDRYSDDADEALKRLQDEELEATLALESPEEAVGEFKPSASAFSPAMLHEVFLNPGIFLLFAGVAIGFISRLQGEKVTAADDQLFVELFQGVLCLFLLEMGMTAASKLRDLKSAGWQFVLFGLVAPNLFAAVGLGIVHLYSLFLGRAFDTGTYVLFAVLCGSASYIALPAVQRMAIREASPTLPLASSLGLTFSYNVTIGIPVYLLMANALVNWLPVHAIASRV